jgi:hypothetical protein
VKTPFAFAGNGFMGFSEHFSSSGKICRKFLPPPPQFRATPFQFDLPKDEDGIIDIKIPDNLNKIFHREHEKMIGNIPRKLTEREGMSH